MVTIRAVASDGNKSQQIKEFLVHLYRLTIIITMNTTTLLPHHLSSAYALVKALKSTSSVDTPALSKLDIATRALADQTVYLPNRYQIIQDWVVDSWLDTKSRYVVHRSSG